MGYFNYFSSMVQLLEDPSEIFLNDNIIGASFYAELPQTRGSTLIQVEIWGKGALDVLDFYQTDDYVLVEGYLSLLNIEDSDSVTRNFNQVTLSVLKIHPVLFEL